MRQVRYHSVPFFLFMLLLLAQTFNRERLMPDFLQFRGFDHRSAVFIAKPGGGPGVSENIFRRNLYNDTLKAWQQMETVEDVCRAYPQRMMSLLRAINLNLESLKEIKAAYETGNISLACTLLLDYYKKGNSGQYVRKSLLSFSKARDTTADSIVQNIFTFYNQPARVPQDSNGHLNWKYHGPEDDIEWAWALNRHFHLGVLLEAYFKTGNPEYAKKINTDIKDWVISSLPYPAVKSSTELWRGLEVSFRSKFWARIFYGLINIPELSPATRLLMLSSVPEHAHYLRSFHNQGNWLTMEMSGLATIATAWPEFNQSPSWVAYTKETMTKSLMEQVYPDGAQTELTSSYHQVALDNFSLFMEIFKQSKQALPGLYRSQIEKMWNYLAYTMRPDGYGLLNNDADLNYTGDRIAEAARLYGRKDWLYIATNGEKGIRPKGLPSSIFPWAGHFITRSGFKPKAHWAFFDIGPWGTGHQHNDKLHLSVSAYGQDFLVDGGRFAYRGEVAKKFRDYATGSFSHNVILIDGKGQSPGPMQAKQPLSNHYFKIAEQFDYASNSFDRFNGVEGESRHTRALFYVRKKFWVVVDRISTDRPRKIEALWHWHPKCKVGIKNKTVVQTENEGGNLQIFPVGSANWSVSLEKGQEVPHIQGWYSKRYNEFEPNTTSIYSTEIQKTTSFVWILYPSKNKSPSINAEIISQKNDRTTIRLTDPNEGKWIMTIPFSESSKASYHFFKNRK